MELTLTNVTKTGLGPCPDCGCDHAEHRISRSYDHGVPEPGYCYWINCPECGWREQGYKGPDV